MKKTIIFDIDGTLADLNGREQFLHNGKKDWKNFNANMDKDLPNTPHRGTVPHVIRKPALRDYFGIRKARAFPQSNRNMADVS